MSAERHAQIFRVALVASTALLVYMFLPFLAILLAVLVLTVVSWPIHERLSRKTGPVLSALLTTAGVVSVVLGPMGIATWLGLREAWEAMQELLVWVEEGGLESLAADLERLLSGAPSIAAYLDEVDLADQIGPTIGRILENLVQQAAQRITSVFGLLFEGLTQLTVGLASWLALYIKGPQLLAAIRRVGLLSDEYTDRLLVRFRQFAQSVIVGMVATASSQGFVAALGFWLAGAKRVALLGVLTAILSQFPIVGSAIVWVPVAASLVSEGHPWRGLFVALWSLALTASVDNLLKPLVYRGGLDVNPVLVLLSLLAGLTTFGPAGVLIGPLLLVLFLTLWTLYDRDVLGERATRSVDSPAPPASGAGGSDSGRVV